MLQQLYSHQDQVLQKIIQNHQKYIIDLKVKKIIGICLGFQQILYCEGANIVEQKIYHGFQSEIITNKFSNLFDNGKFKVGRYHSLKLKEPFYAKFLCNNEMCQIKGCNVI